MKGVITKEVINQKNKNANNSNANLIFNNFTLNLHYI